MTSQTPFIDSYSKAFGTAQFLRQKTRGEDSPVHVVKAYRGNENIVPLILNLVPFTEQKQSNPCTGLDRS
jgi:hypothetical protein